jgi:hypothetical protein
MAGVVARRIGGEGGSGGVLGKVVERRGCLASSRNPRVCVGRHAKKRECLMKETATRVTGTEDLIPVPVAMLVPWVSRSLARM